MRIVSWNINGIRSLIGQTPSTDSSQPWKQFKSAGARLKAVLDYLEADIICLQETKITRDRLDHDLAHVDGYSGYYSLCRTRGGYSGVVTFCRKSSWKPTATQCANSSFASNSNQTIPSENSTPSPKSPDQKSSELLCTSSECISDASGTKSSEITPTSSVNTVGSVPTTSSVNTVGSMPTTSSLNTVGSVPTTSSVSTVGSVTTTSSVNTVGSMAPTSSVNTVGSITTTSSVNIVGSIPTSSASISGDAACNVRYFVQDCTPFVVEDGFSGVLSDSSTFDAHDVFPNIDPYSRKSLYALDCEGRCVVTDHKVFVLFNVYVPMAHPNTDESSNSDSINGSRFGFKMDFLFRLTQRIEFEIDRGRRVVLVGDMNC
eukprot:892026_1